MHVLALSRPGAALISLSIAAVALGCSASAELFDDQLTGGGSSVSTTGPGGAGGAGGEATATSATTTTSATTATSSSVTTTTSATTGAGGAGGDPGTGGGGGGPPPLVAEVFAHSPDVLYKLDPTTKQVTTIGNFGGCSSVIDIAIDKGGTIFATTFGGLYKIDKLTAACTFVSSGGYPNSLSFVPVGTLDPNVEALVGYNGGQYVRIDTTTGTTTVIGNLGGGYSSSGDVVSLIGGGTYLTVTGNNCNDCIVSIDPSTGALVSLIGQVGHNQVFGLAYWGGVAYGFNNGGQLFQIDVANGSTIDIPIPNAPANLQFWGAGSTTAAPHM